MSSTSIDAIACLTWMRPSASAAPHVRLPTRNRDGLSSSRSCVPSFRPRELELAATARTLRIGQHEIGDHAPCYVIAEIGHNHQGSLEKAREMFREAKLAGAHAVKLQKRDNRGLYTRAAYNKPYDNENSFGATYGEHREFLEFGAKEYRELQAYARELGVDFFSTAFDTASADFLAALDVPAYKIASGDIKSV